MKQRGRGPRAPQRATGPIVAVLEKQGRFLGASAYFDRVSTGINVEKPRGDARAGDLVVVAAGKGGEGGSSAGSGARTSRGTCWRA